ncbi:MAG: putative pterin-4-alpha-carbinolamine dehydratase [Candidatus Binatia bacterium]|nr:MAG: putative pterin-4-alpha-carbinolamine dehydratase [Candidatus Binatia bacterium]
MARPQKLADEEIRRRLAELRGWELREGKLFREFRFSDFVQAFSFLAAAALVAEKLDHHPEWSNVYRTVRVFLSTHDAGGVTELDFQLAATMNELAARWGL